MNDIETPGACRGARWYMASLMTLTLGCAADVSPESTDEALRRTETHVEFRACDEFAGLVPVPLANVARRVPSDYRIAGADTGQATLVVRVAHCAGVRIDGSRERPGTVSQVGVNVESPNGTGDINNYTLYYSTDSAGLFTRLLAAGFDATFSPGLEFEIDDGQLFVDSPSPRRAHFQLSGPVGDAPPPPFPFVANWWQKTRCADAVTETDIPEIGFGDATGVALTTGANSDVARLLGRSTTTFPYLSVHGQFQRATMVIRPL
jgi:hypothetical protein